MKKYLLYVWVALLTLVLVACNSNDNSNDKDATNGTAPKDEEAVSNENYEDKVTENPIVTITMESGEQIVMELMPKIAPNTVANFVSLVQEGFYDGTIFHRVIPGFMVQGGDPTGTGMGGPNYSIAGEFTSNGFENLLAHERGVVSMARALNPDTAGSQFFIMVETATHLDGDYAAFGKVLEGMEVVDKIVSVERDKNDKPLQEQKMKSVVVDTKGFSYPKPMTSAK